MEELSHDCTLLSVFCRAFSNRLRLRILCVLDSGEKTVTEIVENVGASKYNVSQQLKYLRLTNVISFRKDGRQNFYQIKNRKLVDLLFEVKRKVSSEEFEDVISNFA